MEKNTSWLPGWTLRWEGQFSLTNLGIQIAVLTMLGQSLSRIAGAFPRYNTILPHLSAVEQEIYRDGTNGNLAIRVPNDPEQFIVTARGADKTDLRPENFTLVNKRSIDWEVQILPYYAITAFIQPSTDALLAAVCFQHACKASVYAHIHQPLRQSEHVQLPYPATSLESLQPLVERLSQGYTTFNLLGHDPLRNPGKKRLDASIILGESLEGVVQQIDFL